MSFVLIQPVMSLNVILKLAHDKIIEQQEAEILRLKAEIAIVNSERDQIKKEFDTMKVLLREIQ